MKGTDYLDRLSAAAEAARTELENRPTGRWEFFAKASFFLAPAFLLILIAVGAR